MALHIDDYLDLESLKQPVWVPQFDATTFGPAQPTPALEAFLPEPPSGVARLFGAAKHEKQAQEAQARFDAAMTEHRRWSAERERTIAAARAQYDADAAARIADIRHRNGQVDELREQLVDGMPDAITTYLNLVLERSAYPDGFANEWRLAFVPDSAQLVVEYELPTLEVIPTVKVYKYVKSTDTISKTPLPVSQVRAQYAAIVAQTALRVVHEMLEADRESHIESIVFNGMVKTTDPATGKAIHPCLLTLRTTRSRFGELDLAQVYPAACLRYLGAGVSRSPAELAPVRPVLEFDMVDPRFIDADDVLAGLDTRPNLLEMSPTEFEELIQNLFAKMGLETRLTRASRDGGVDCVAYDPRPVMGGKVVIQAKRYRLTVGVAAVRDLYGTLLNEGASKGILVTTSGYGPASVDFAANKPLELLDGSHLLYLLDEHAGIQARIEAPPDWQDPHADSADISEAPVVDEAPTRSTLTAPSGQIGPPSPPSSAVEMTAGQNIVVIGPSLTLHLDTVGISSAACDMSFLVLKADGKVGSDNDFVFYNQPTWGDGAITLYLGGLDRSGVLDLPQIPDAVERIVLVASTDSTAPVTPRVKVQDSAGDVHSFAPVLNGVMPALLCAEIYRRKGSWRFRAIGQGYADGLAGVAHDFGVNID